MLEKFLAWIWDRFRPIFLWYNLLFKFWAVLYLTQLYIQIRLIAWHHSKILSQPRRRCRGWSNRLLTKQRTTSPQWHISAANPFNFGTNYIEFLHNFYVFVWKLLDMYLHLIKFPLNLILHAADDLRELIMVLLLNHALAHVGAELHLLLEILVSGLGIWVDVFNLGLAFFERRK